VPLKIEPALNNANGRDALVSEVLAEFSQLTMRDWMGAMKRWHRGSVSLVHLNVMMLLRSNGPQTMGKLAEALDVSVASTTGIVDRMESKNLVERRRSATDRRVVEVHISTGGEEWFRAMEAERRSALTTLLGEISGSDLAALLSGLRAFRAARDRLIGHVPDALRDNK
jgi:DNA-binding MarR family transcriptional regulator